MKCRVVRRHIGDYLDGALSALGHEAFREHVSCCPHCRALLDEARRIRDILRDPGLEIAPPPGLANRIKHLAAQVQEEAQIRARPCSSAVGSPAFVATCASVFMGAVMFYVVITQLDMGGFRGPVGIGAPTVVASVPGTPGSVDPVAVVVVEAPVSGTATVEAARVSEPSRRDGSPRTPRAAPAGTDAVSPRRLATAPPGLPRPALASPAPARPATATVAPPAAPVRIASATVAKAVEAPRPLVEGPADRIASAATGAKSRSGVRGASADEASRGVVAGLVAGYVVERYVVDRIIQSEPTLLAVTTSTPSSTGTALTERMKQ